MKNFRSLKKLDSIVKTCHEMCLESLQCVADTSEYFNTKIEHLKKDNQKLDAEVKDFQWMTSNLKRDIENLSGVLDDSSARADKRHDLFLMFAIVAASVIIVLIVAIIIQCCQIRKMKFIRYQHY